MGAWIEISNGYDEKTPYESLPVWERGLKYAAVLYNHETFPSLPVWERGLKSIGASGVDVIGGSLPVWERG